MYIKDHEHIWLFSLEACCFLKGNIGKSDQRKRGGEGKLGGVEGVETVARMYFMSE